MARTKSLVQMNHVGAAFVDPQVLIQQSFHVSFGKTAISGGIPQSGGQNPRNHWPMLVGTIHASLDTLTFDILCHLENKPQNYLRILSLRSFQWMIVNRLVYV